MAQPKIEKDRSESTRDRILMAAEEMIADMGYDNATARKIATAAGVPVALLNYHFGSKEGLLRAIFERRAPTVVDQRVAGLQLARTEPDLDKRVELVVKALIVPMFHQRGESRSALFGRIMARELSDPAGAARGIFRDLFDPVADMMIAAIWECFPDWTKTEVHWAYHTMLGAMLLIMADTGRIARLSDGDCSPDNYQQATTHVVALLTAGLKYRDRSQTKGT